MSEETYSQTIYFRNGRHDSTATGLLKEDTEILINRWTIVNQPLNFWQDPSFTITTEKSTQIINLRDISSVFIKKEAR